MLCVSTGGGSLAGRRPGRKTQTLPFVAKAKDCRGPALGCNQCEKPQVSLADSIALVGFLPLRS
jgi:hypothetical protein